MQKTLINQKGKYFLADNGIPCTCPFADAPVIPVQAKPAPGIVQLNGNNETGVMYEPQYFPCNSNCPHFNLSADTTQNNKVDLQLSCGSGKFFPKIEVTNFKKDGL